MELKPNTQFKLPDWTYAGGWPAELWITFEERSREYIMAGAKPLDGKDHPFQLQEFIGEFPGGLRGPHLHYQGKTYLVDAKQWKEFSDKVVKEFVTKLERANAIPVQQMHELNSIISGLSMKA